MSRLLRSRFRPAVPARGEPATEPTDIWVLFDDDNAVRRRVLPRQPAGRGVANELRRDDSTSSKTTTSWSCSTRSTTGGTASSSRRTAERRPRPGDQRRAAIRHWNTVWAVRSARSEEGWSLEMAIPFKSLRYRGGSADLGFQLTAHDEVEERIFVSDPMPAAYGNAGFILIHRRPRSSASRPRLPRTSR